jgi:tRNA pseudouridine55 synthase
MIRPFDPFDGALLVDKPAGPTSHDIVEAVRSHLCLSKVGHCGTLDPAATGLIVLLLGRATKLAEKLMTDDKVYTGWLTLGATTDSYDAEGEITSTGPVAPSLTLEQLADLADTFTGDQMQVPPMVSAVKKNGVPLYKLARKGIEVEREPRLVHIYRFRFLDYQPPSARFVVACTKGTYVRTLVHDFGQKLGCGAHLSMLRRSVSGRFDVADAILYEDLLHQPRELIQKRVIPFLKVAG